MPIAKSSTMLQIEQSRQQKPSKSSFTYNNHPLTYIMPLDEVVNGEVAKPRWNVIEEEDDGVELRRPIVSLLVEFVANAPAISEQQERLRL